MEFSFVSKKIQKIMIMMKKKESLFALSYDFFTGITFL